MGNIFKKPAKWGSANWLLLAPSRTPQSAVEKCIGNLLNGEPIQNSAKWGSTESREDPRLLDCCEVETSNLGKKQ